MFARPAVAHDAFARADDRDAHAVQDLRKIIDLAVHAAAGLAFAVEHVNDLFAAHRIFELDANLALLLVGDHVVVLDVAFVLEHLRDAGADFALPDQHHSPADPVGVANPRQHVRDGIL